MKSQTKKKLLRWLGLSCLPDASKSANNHMSLFDETVNSSTFIQVISFSIRNGETEFNRKSHRSVSWSLKAVPLLGNFLGVWNEIVIINDSGDCKN